MLKEPIDGDDMEVLPSTYSTVGIFMNRVPAQEGGRRRKHFIFKREKSISDNDRTLKIDT